MGQAAPGARHGRNGRLVTQRVRPGKMESDYSATRGRLAPSHADSLVWTEVGRRGREGGGALTARDQPLRTPHMCLRAASYCAGAITASHASEDSADKRDTGHQRRDLPGPY